MVERAEVACGSCRACCRGEAIMLFPADGDLIETYQTFDGINPINGHAAKFVAQKENGDCVYLGAEGCAIHARAPAICRKFDCAGLYRRFMEMPRADRRRLKKLVDGPVMEAGRERAK